MYWSCSRWSSLSALAASRRTRPIAHPRALISSSTTKPSWLVSSWPRSACRRRSGGRVAAAPPGGDERRVLVGSVFPGEVACVEDVELAVRQPVVEELGVDRRHRGVVPAGDDLHRDLYLRQHLVQHGLLCLG